MSKQKGKYAHLMGALKRLPGISGDANADPGYQAKVDKVKEGILAERTAEEDARIAPPPILPQVLDEANRLLKAALYTLMRRCAGRRHGIELAHAYAAARDLKDRIKAWQDEANLLVEAYAQLMTEQLEAEGSKGVDLNGRALSFHEEPWTKTLDNDRVAAFFWADPGLRPSLRPMWQTLDSLNRKRLLNGEEPIPGTEVWAKRKIRLGGE